MRPHNRSRFLTIALALGISTQLHEPLSAQLYAEVRGGAAVGSHTATAAAMELEPGLSLAGTLSLQTKGTLGLYAGFVRTEFGCVNGFCTDRDITFTGNDIRLGISVGRQGPWMQAGLLYGGTGAGTDKVSSGIGVEAGAGLAFTAGKFRFSPGIMYRRHNANSLVRTDHAVSLSFDLGIGLQIRN